jgi:rubrerythrin
MGLQIDFAHLSAKDVLDLAIAAEAEAKENYEQIATWMKGRGNVEVAEFFTTMADLEQIHCDQITEHRRRLFGDEPPSHRETAAWEVEAPDYDRISMDMSIRAALETALDAEVKAHDYYAGALDYVADPAVTVLFEELRLAELQHQRMIRRQIGRLEGRDEPEG